MKREEIEKVAGEYSCGILGFQNDTHVMNVRKAFLAGYEWRINSVWHKTTERPYIGSHIVVILKNGNLVTWLVTDEITEDFAQFNADKWAYMEDLLPNEKGDIQ